MSQLSFFRSPAPLSLAAVAAEIGVQLGDGADPSRTIRAVVPLDRAERDDASAFFEGLIVDELLETRAGACLVAPRHLGQVPRGTCALVTDQPRDALRRLTAMLHPASLRPSSLFNGAGIDPSARIAASARLEPGVVIDPGAIVGPDVEIGAGSFIGAGSHIGTGVRIGRACAIDAGVSLAHTLLGDRVIVHAGARLGHGGRDLTASRRDPSLGRLIVQDDVEIGANATLARGGFADTVIGEGARVGALASIGADVVIERGALVMGMREALLVSPSGEKV